MPAMDEIKALPDVDFPQILEPTHKILYPLLEANRSTIESVPRKTFKYGTTDRHQLDVYYPKGVTGPVPILFWVYGGGFVAGARIIPGQELQYANIGAFFTSRGIAVVIPDYRLAPEFKYPAGGEDVKDAIVWVAANLSTINEDAPSQLDVNNIFAMGHSAGAVHVITAFLAPNTFPDTLRKSVKGLILLGAAYHWRNVPPGVQTPSVFYYGSNAEEVRKVEPLGLFENASENVLGSLPDLLVMRSERELTGFQALHDGFLEFIKAKQVVKVDDGIMEKHNHLSIALALGGGEGEEWGVKVAEWVKLRL